MMFEHIVAQDIVRVAADRRTAQGRFRTFLQGGVLRSRQGAPPLSRCGCSLYYTLRGGLISSIKVVRAGLPQICAAGRTRIG